MAVPLYFDPRQQPVKFPRPSPQQVQTAKEACFAERADFIRHYARLGGLHGLRAIEDVYGPEAIAAILEFDRMGDEHGPATMSRLLQVYRMERGQ